MRGWSGRTIASLGVIVSTLLAGAGQAQSFTSGITSGTITNATITEASGIAASRFNPNVLWTHEDSGNPAKIYAITSTGFGLGTYSLSGASNTDWEDIAVGPGPTANTQYVYVGDIGDNNAARGSIAIYRVPEPVVSDVQSPVTTSLSNTKFTLQYPTGADPDGNPQGAQDAESLFVDPISKDVYIVTKRLSVKHVYEATLPATSSGSITLSLVATLNMTTWITGGDITVDGSAIAIRGGSTALLYLRPNGGSVADAFATTPISIPLLSEVQGEAIGFDALGQGYYTTSEGTAPPIHYFGRVPMTLYWDQDGTAVGSYAATGAGMGGTGSWDTTSTKWYNPSGVEMLYTAGSNAVFWGGAGTVALSSAQNVNSMAFKTDGYTVTGSIVTLGGPTITVDAGATATISSVVAGASGLTKNGPGTLKLAKGNTYSGGTTINAGTLGIISNALGAIPGSNSINVTINNGSALRFDVNNLSLAATRQIQLGSGAGIIDTNGNNDTIAGLITGSGSLTKTGAGSLTVSSANNYTGATNVQAGKLLIGATLTTSSALDVSDGAIAELAAGGSTLLRTGSLNTHTSGKIDLNDNKAIVDYSGPSPIDNIRTMIKTGYNGGNWNGNGITSATAALDAASGTHTSIAEIEATDLFSSFPATFDGQSIDNTTVLLLDTIAGDADMNGTVNLLDFNRLAANFGHSGHWSQADFNYDGTIDILDFNILAADFGQSRIVTFAMPAELRSAASAAAVVPLPSALWGGAGLLFLIALVRCGTAALGCASLCEWKHNRGRLRHITSCGPTGSAFDGFL